MYNAVAIYSLDGTFIAYGIKGDSDKLQTTNLYPEGDEDQLREQLARLNEKTNLNLHWPHPQDPEVKALLDDPTFAPIQYREVEVVDEDNSYYVWKKIADPANPGQWIDGPELDEDSSVLVYKTSKVPERPTDQMVRIKKACETVARRRANLSTSSQAQ